MTSVASVSTLGLVCLLQGLAPCAWADSYEFKLLHTFHHSPNSPEGADPQGLVYVAADGSVYGTTRRGGSYGAGTMFRIDGRSGALQTLHTFSGIDGLQPDACLLAGKDGNFYGTVGVQYRSVYRVGLDGSFATVLAYPQSPDPSAPRQAVLVKGVDGNVYAQSDRPDFAGRSGFGLLADGTATAAPPDFEIVSVPVDQAAANGIASPAAATPRNEAPVTRTGRFTPGISLCGDALLAPDGILYALADISRSPTSTTEPGEGLRITILTEENPADPKLAPWAASGELPFVSKDRGLNGVVHWLDAGAPKAAAYFKAAFYYRSVWMTPGRDGYFYALAANSAGSLSLLRVSRTGVAEIALNLPDTLTTGNRSELWPLTAGPDGALYGVAGAIGRDDNSGAVFEIIHHR